VKVTLAASKGSKGEGGFVDVRKRGCFAWEYKRKDNTRTSTKPTASSISTATRLIAPRAKCLESFAHERDTGGLRPLPLWQLEIGCPQALEIGVHMSVRNSHAKITSRRAELLAELFFQDLNPVFVSKPTEEVGYDLLVGFSNEKSGINTFAVDVKAIEEPPSGSVIHISRSAFDRMAHSNVPGLLLVADVKRNRLYYAWLSSKESHGAGNNVAVPITELNDQAIAKLKTQLKKVGFCEAVVG
jgi:hypothetical protein